MKRSVHSCYYFGAPLTLAHNQNYLLVTINLPDIVQSSLQCDLQPTGLSFKAQAGCATSLYPSVLRSSSLSIVFRAGEPKEYEFKVDLYKDINPEVLATMPIAWYILTSFFPS